MQIQFKQSEIIAALKQYIATQGINLQGKSVEIAFSATRGAAGIVADVTIEEVEIPGFSDSVADDAKPALTVVPTTEAKAAEEVKPKAEASETAEGPATPTTSLFNN
jgi:hypothetical protein